jgi:anthranilate phosphoribosyltransferase
MDTLKNLTSILKRKENLTKEQIKVSIDLLVSEKVEFSEKESFLISFAQKGEIISEIASFINYFLELSRDPELSDFSENAIDLCGTGGDRAGSFNISTFVSFIIAAAGIPVIKHGNRSISSKCGSADLLEAIGIPLEVEKNKRQEGVKFLNYAFLFAPAFHPAFKHIAPVRKELAKKGVITIFNILGPMINPARPGYQLLGVYSEKLVSKISESLDQSGKKSGFVIHGRIKGNATIQGIDELSSCGENIVQGFGQNSSTKKTIWDVEKFGCNSAPIEHIAGGDLSENLRIMERLLDGSASTGLTDSILMNASLAFLTTGRTKNLEEGVDLAKKLLKDGTVKTWVAEVTTFFK